MLEILAPCPGGGVAAVGSDEGDVGFSVAGESHNGKITPRLESPPAEKVAHTRLFERTFTTPEGEGEDADFAHDTVSQYYSKAD